MTLLANRPCAAFVLLLIPLLSARLASASYTVNVDAVPPDAVSPVRETVGFRIALQAPPASSPDDGAGLSVSLAWQFLHDGRPAGEGGEGTLIFSEGKTSATLDARMERPGFLQCVVTPEPSAETDRSAANKPKPVRAAVAIAPGEIAPARPAPDDFDAFWDFQKLRLAQTPAARRSTPVPVEMLQAEKAAANLVAFDLTIDCLGAPVSGYFAKPADAKPRSLPAILMAHSAGVDGASLRRSLSWAGEAGGMLALDVNAHGLPNGQPRAFYEDQRRGPLRDYQYQGRSSRESYYFLGMYLRMARALQFLTEQPEWDGRRIIVYGVSQGGAQAIAAAALDKRVSFVVASVPALCDLAGPLADRAPGWPAPVPFDADGRPDAGVLNTAGYYDTVNFASRLDPAAEVFMTVGFIDTTCPPAGVYAAYNQIRGPKKIYHDVAAGHALPARTWPIIKQAVLDYLKRTKPDADRGDAVANAPLS